MKKAKIVQRAIITLRDSEDGIFTADLHFEPSIKGRTTQSPCVNAALRLAAIIQGGKEKLIAPIPLEKKLEVPA